MIRRLLSAVAAGTGTLAIATSALAATWNGTAHRACGSAIARYGRLVAAAVGGFLHPWSVLVDYPYGPPRRHRTGRWPGPAWMLRRPSQHWPPRRCWAEPTRGRQLTATVGGTLLLIDAWFDVCTSAPGPDRACAAAETAGAEVPLAVAAFWLAVTLTRNASEER